MTKSVSADYDKLAEFFDDVQRYLSRLKVLEGLKLDPELEKAVTEVLASVLVLCGVCSKYMKMPRMSKHIFQFIE